MPSDPIAPEVGCSTISLRLLPLPRALSEIAGQGFAEIDLGALPGVCDHVPTPLPADAVDVIAAQVAASGLAVRTINADIGAMDDPSLDAAELQRRLRTLVQLALATDAPTIILPCGSQGITPRTGLRTDVAAVATALRTAAAVTAEAGVELLVEAPHSRRLCNDLDRSEMLREALGDAPVGTVLDFSHVVASGDDVQDAVRRLGDQVRHVHLRDAVLGDINRSIGRGAVDFAGALESLWRMGYTGHYSLELETHDIANDERAPEAGRAGRYITSLLRR